MSLETLSLAVTADAEGARLDQFLVARLEGRTRSAVRRWIVDGRVHVDGAAASKPGHALREGMQVEIRLPEPPANRPQPEALPLERVHEDEHLIVVNKAAGMVVHRGHGHDTGTLVNALLGAGVTLAAAGGPQRPGIVHRLDEGTSGLILVAKTDAAFHAAAAAFANREVRKRYRALVWGSVDPPAGKIDRGIGRSRSNPVKMSVSGTRGALRRALTVYRTRESLPGFSHLEVDLHTGRTHQIRVHLQSIHHPVVGDERYGGRPWHGVQDPQKRKALRTFDRLALHASDLELRHPVTGEALCFHSPLPEEIEGLMRVLRGPA